MKKARNWLNYFGLLNLVAALLFRAFHSGPVKTLFTMAIFLFLIATIISLFLPRNQQGRYATTSIAARGLTIAGNICTILICLGILFKIFDVPGSAYLLEPGYIVSLIILAIVIVAIPIYSRVQKNITKGQPDTLENLAAAGLTIADLYQYTGQYNNAAIPLKINVSINEHTLIAQATGQSAFYLRAINKTNFRYEQGKIEIEFPEGKDELILKQHGGFFPFIKEA